MKPNSSLTCLARLSQLSVLALAPFTVVAQAPSEADQIREELRQLKKDYQQRIDQLEERLQRLETPATKAVTKPAAPQSGVRPIIHFNKYISLAFEGGVDWVKNTGQGTSDYLYKLTLAPQVSLGNRFFSRPVIRAFVIYAHWGDEFRGQVGGNDYQNDTEGMTYGVQMEAWW